MLVLGVMPNARPKRKGVRVLVECRLKLLSNVFKKNVYHNVLVSQFAHVLWHTNDNDTLDSY